MSSSTGFSVASIFLTFEAPQARWDVLPDSQDNSRFSRLGSTGLIKCQDVSVSLDSFFAFSFLIFVTPCFLRADAIFCSAANANALFLITPLEVLSFSCG